MKLTDRRGRLRLRLDATEVTLLQLLIDDLDTVLDGTGTGSTADGHAGESDEVLDRLYPAAYRGDDEAASEFRMLTETSLTADRMARIDACRAELAAGREVELSDPDAARRWIQLLNDLRLTAGTRLGITEDDDIDFDPRNPADQPKVVYYWLTAVQDTVVRALMP